MAKVKDKPNRRTSRALIITSIAVGLLLLLDTLFIGNVAYGVKWAQCGTMPIALGSPAQIGEGSYPSMYHARMNPNWLRAKQPALPASDVSLYCNIEDVYRVVGEEKVVICENDSITKMVARLGFGDGC